MGGGATFKVSLKDRRIMLYERVMVCGKAGGEQLANESSVCLFFFWRTYGGGLDLAACGQGDPLFC